MNLMERFADPALMPSMAVSEKLAGAGITTIMGMGVTFVVLFLLWGCLALMGKITVKFTGGPGNSSGKSEHTHGSRAVSSRGRTTKASTGNHQPETQARGALHKKTKMPFDAVPEGEIIAVISAAVAAASGTGARMGSASGMLYAGHGLDGSTDEAGITIKSIRR